MDGAPPAAAAVPAHENHDEADNDDEFIHTSPLLIKQERVVPANEGAAHPVRPRRRESRKKILVHRTNSARRLSTEMEVPLDRISLDNPRRVSFETEDQLPAPAAEPDEQPLSPWRLFCAAGWKRLPLGLLIGLIVFIVFAVVPLDMENPAAGRAQSITLGLLIVMCIWWFTETLPIGITGLLPIAVFPFFGVVKVDVITSEYANDVIFLFVGSFSIAVAMERWNLHKRFAYLVLLKLGADVRKNLAGFIGIGMFLSMFLSNSTTAMILTPIVTAVSEHLERSGEGGLQVERGFLLGVAFAVGIGGCATPVGSPTNLVVLKVYRQLFPGGPDITFLTWVAFGLPLAIISCFVLYFIIWLFFLRGYHDDMSAEEHASVHKRALDDLGPMCFAEKVVLVDLIILMLLWIFRGDFNVSAGPCIPWQGCMPGWSNLFPRPNFIGDGGVSVLAAIPLFLFPSRSSDPEKASVLDWKTCVTHLPFDVLWLMGGGFALARGLEESGLSKRLGLGLQGLSHLPPEVILTICVLVAMVITQFASNTGTAALLAPIIAAVAVGIRLNPVYLMVPVIISCSFAFLLPVSTPPDAIVYATNKITIPTMAKTGSVTLVATFILLIACWLAFGRFIFGADPTHFPDWADIYRASNSTAPAAPFVAPPSK